MSTDLGPLYRHRSRQRPGSASSVCGARGGSSSSRTVWSACGPSARGRPGTPGRGTGPSRQGELAMHVVRDRRVC